MTTKFEISNSNFPTRSVAQNLHDDAGLVLSAGEALRTVGTWTLISGVVIGVIGFDLGPGGFLCFLPIEIMGLIYLICAGRVEKGRRIPGFLALALAVVHAGVMMLIAGLVIGYSVTWVWSYHIGVGIAGEDDSTPNWLIFFVVELVALTSVVTLCRLVMPIAKYLRRHREKSIHGFPVMFSADAK